MKRALLGALALVSVGLAGCVETPQTASARKSDVAAYQGGNDPYAAPGWKAGDQASWAQQIRSRAQSGQNEYTRAVAP